MSYKVLDVCKYVIDYSNEKEYGISNLKLQKILYFIQACGLRHLAFCVDSVEQTVKELAEVGIECEPIRVDDYTGKKMTFFHDPDGLPLELHE